MEVKMNSTVRFFKHPVHGAMCKGELLAITCTEYEREFYIELKFDDDIVKVTDSDNVYMDEHGTYDVATDHQLEKMEDHATRKAYVIFADGHYELVMVMACRYVVAPSGNQFHWEASHYQIAGTDTIVPADDVFFNYNEMLMARSVWYYDENMNKKVELGGYQTKIQQFNDAQLAVMTQIEALLDKAKDLGLVLVHNLDDSWDALQWATDIHFDGKHLTYGTYDDDFESMGFEKIEVKLDRKINTNLVTYNPVNCDCLVLANDPVLADECKVVINKI